MIAAYLPLSSVFWICIAVAPFDNLDWRQESMQASRKHRLQTCKRRQRAQPASVCTQASASTDGLVATVAAHIRHNVGTTYLAPPTSKHSL